MSFLDSVVGIFKKVAPIAAGIVLPGSGSIVSGLMDSVLKDNDIKTEALSDEDKAMIISKKPELLADLKAKAYALEAEIAREQTKNMQTVGETMQAELKDGRWYQRAWRPWCGFLFPTAVLGVYVAWPIIRALLMVSHPTLALAGDIDVPASLWVAWCGILGVAVYGRNQEKMAGKDATQGVLAKLANKFLK